MFQRLTAVLNTVKRLETLNFRKESDFGTAKSLNTSERIY